MLQKIQVRGLSYEHTAPCSLAWYHARTEVIDEKSVVTKSQTVFPSCQQGSQWSVCERTAWGHCECNSGFGSFHFLNAEKIVPIHRQYHLINLTHRSTTLLSKDNATAIRKDAYIIFGHQRLIFSLQRVAKPISNF